MRVAIVGSFWYGSLEESYARAFESIGWEVARCSLETLGLNSLLPTQLHGMANAVRSILNVNLLRESISRHGPDLVLVIKGTALPARWIAEMRSEVLIVNFNPDSPWEPINSSTQLLASLPYYHHHFTWNRQLLPAFQSGGAGPVSWLPFAYDPTLHRPMETCVSAEFDAVFIGTYDEQRDKLLGTLSGCKIGIWGNGWSRARHVPPDWIRSEAVYGAEAVRIQALGRCAINILRAQNVHSHNMRTFEIPATGQVMLSTRSEEQMEFFAEGVGAYYYSHPDELRAKIEEIVAEPARAKDIALFAHKRVKEETYAARAQHMLAVLGLSSD